MLEWYEKQLSIFAKWTLQNSSKTSAATHVKRKKK